MRQDTMLIPQANSRWSVRRRGFGSTDPLTHDAVTSERLRRQEQAELLARIGTFELAIGLDGERENQHWSPGIYAILHRDRSAPALSRNAYVLQYVHPEDQTRVLSLGRQAIAHGRSVEMIYRIVRDDGGISCVTERLSLVTTTPTERLVFGDLTDTRLPEPLFAIPVQENGIASMPTALPDAQSPSSTALQAVMTTLDKFKEAEQLRLAREMHDDFGQLLAAMKLDLCTLQRKLTHAEPAAADQIENLHELVNAMISSVRRIIAAQPPKAVEETGLFAAFEQLVTGFRKRHAVSITTRLIPPTIPIDHRIELAAYRILQEALSNTVRHSGATKVEIAAGCSETHFSLRITDNGKGTSADDLQKTGSFGMLSMRARVHALTGTISVDSTAGQGTSLVVSLPL